MSPRRLRIVHFINHLGGGAGQEWIREIVRLTRPQLFEHTVCYLESEIVAPEGRLPADLWAGELRANGAAVVPLPLRKGLHLPFRDRSVRRVLSWLLLVDRFRELENAARIAWFLARGGFDIVHLHNTSLLPGGIAAMLLRKPIAFSVPAAAVELRTHGSGTRVIYRLLGQRIDILFTGLSVDDVVSFIGVEPSRVRELRGEIDLARATPVPREHNTIVRELGLEGAFPILLAVGALVAKKGQAHAIEAVAQLVDRWPACRLLLLGEGDLRIELEALARDLGVGSRVVFAGYRTDIGAFHSVADIYLRTMLLEARNRSLYWAMAYANPVVGFAVPCEAEPVHGGEDGVQGLLVPPGDSSALAEAIDRLARSPELRLSMGRDARRYAEAHFDIGPAIRCFEDAYLELARHHSH